VGGAAQVSIVSLCFMQISQYMAEVNDQGNLTLGSPTTVDCEQP
jgi:hypothetical protein